MGRAHVQRTVRKEGTKRKRKRGECEGWRSEERGMERRGKGRELGPNCIEKRANAVAQRAQHVVDVMANLDHAAEMLPWSRQK